MVFGDVLVSELPLRWVMITDEYGTDPTLRFKNTSLNINPLTMICKRVESDEPVDVFRLLQQNREALSGAENGLPRITGGSAITLHDRFRGLLLRTLNCPARFSG